MSPRSYADPSNVDSWQSLISASTWAALRNQCPKNYDKLRTTFAQNFPSLNHTRALTEHVRQISGRRWPTTHNYMLWLMEAMCTARGHTHTIEHEVK